MPLSLASGGYRWCRTIDHTRMNGRAGGYKKRVIKKTCKAEERQGNERIKSKKIALIPLACDADDPGGQCRHRYRQNSPEIQ